MLTRAIEMAQSTSSFKIKRRSKAKVNWRRLNSLNKIAVEGEILVLIDREKDKAI